jgi:hypothetical protein
MKDTKIIKLCFLQAAGSCSGTAIATGKSCWAGVDHYQFSVDFLLEKVL